MYYVYYLKSINKKPARIAPGGLFKPCQRKPENDYLAAFSM
jgi:hypothetical protein